jgi:hypothetical protein
LLRESDARGEKYRRLLEKYLDHPDRDRIVAHEMGWSWLEEALDKNEENSTAQGDIDERIDDEDSSSATDRPMPEPLHEGIDWVRDDRGDVVHPIQKRAKESLYKFLDELRAAGHPQEHHEALGEFVAHSITLSAKLAGALGSLARGWVGPDAGLTIASLKRALGVLHQALTAAAAIGTDQPFPAARLAHYRNELFAIREDLLALMAKLRAR